MAETLTAVAPTSPGQAHHNTLVVPHVSLCFSRCPGARDAGISAPYKVWTDLPSHGGRQFFSAQPDPSGSGVVRIPWRLDLKGNPTHPFDRFLVLEIFDTFYRVFLRSEIERIDVRADLALTPEEMRAATNTGAPNARLRAVQERFDLLGYLTGYLENDTSDKGVMAVNDKGTNDANTEQAILNFQQDSGTLQVTGIMDRDTMLALLLRAEADGYRHGA